MCKQYNGWTNWETWVINLYYGDMFYEDMRETLERDPSMTVADFADMYADMVREFHSEELRRVDTVSLVREFFDGGMSSVNWYELADANYDDICDELEIDRSE